MAQDISIPGEGEKSPSPVNKWVRALANLIGGAIPIAGAVVQAGTGVWGETEQERAMDAVRAWIKMLEEEDREKQRTILEILARVDLHDDEIGARIKSDEYQELMKKAFRGWSRTQSRTKQQYVRDILSHAAATRIVTDDVVSLFLEWVQDYSEFHFQVIGEIYRNPHSTRADIWENLGRGEVREDSAEADLFKLLVHDLATGRVIRQHRDTDYAGNFLAKRAARPARKSNVARRMKSAFDDKEQYELTALGAQFVHYAMTDLPIKITFAETSGADDA
jgi:hypothetical protein